MGRSMISPLGLAIKPRMPASCRTCWRLPRAPESTIKWIGLNSLRSSIFLDLAEHHVGDLIAGVRPDIDDLVVALAVGDDAAAILLVHLFDLLVRILQLGFFPLWNDHVLDANRDTSLESLPLNPSSFSLSSVATVTAGPAI